MDNEQTGIGIEYPVKIYIQDGDRSGCAKLSRRAGIYEMYELFSGILISCGYDSVAVSGVVDAIFGCFDE